MISKHTTLRSIAATALLIVSLNGAAASGENCAMIDKSIAQGRAVASETMVYAAVSATDPSILGTKTPVSTAKRKLQSMFLKYCGEFSGYKAFQVEARGGVSGSVVCDGKTNYAFAIKKSEITIKELTGPSETQTVEMPDFENKNDLFEEFK